jgi:hypothetical protein
MVRSHWSAVPQCPQQAELFRSARFSTIELQKTFVGQNNIFILVIRNLDSRTGNHAGKVHGK